jgi:drug/metabolite transporter (DMT)-like permease
MNARAFDYAILGIGVAAVSTAAVLIREADAPAMVIAASRVALASPPLLLLAGLRRDRVLPHDRHLLALTLLSGICLAVHFGLWVASVKQTSIVTSVVLVTTTPLFVGLLGGPLLGERPGRSIWLAIAVSAMGTALLVSEDLDAGGDTLTGDAFALLGAMFAAGYIMTGRRVLAASNAWLPYVTTSYSVAAVILLATALAAGETLGGYSGKTYALLVALAVVPQLIGHTSVNRSLGHLPAIVISIAVLGEPVGATILGAIFLSEEPTLLQLAGGLVVLVGVALGVRGDVRTTPAERGV